ncbi:Type 4 fimbrial biogenesis protein PilY1 [Desulfurella amilsii]|uniref:Type 4 fimbrial biogenesis protein PilY1 n=1 Tax=Desulfurella amilsii TaxID=1562698 RepID=A0A1X4XZL3_9BACT|nr:PilC/PilY family type IV pilus protein [Desulfurella amilsii]OSS42975.1 Type 4 fimbrial biogenesis protein PilY1 [Desulfurella amilsii]
MIKKLLLVLWAFLMFSPYAMADCKSPSASAIPPFLGSAVSIPPNVLIVMDISGSMSWKAYTGRYTGTEEGYFDPNAVYSYNSNDGYWYQSQVNSAKCPTDRRVDGGYCGSYLNFHYMTRIDLLQWVLTGGSPKYCSNNNQSCDPRLNNNGNDIMLTTYNGVDVLTPMSRINNSLLLSLANSTQNTKPRIGLEMFSNNVSASKVYIGDYDKSGNTGPNNPYTNLIRMINSATPGGSTATGPAMKAALDYFNQSTLNIGTDCEGQGYSYSNGFNTSKGTWKDPMYQPCKSDCITKSCSFCSAECANNYVILMSDGDWNSGGDPLKPAWYMYNKFSRPLNNTNFTINKVYTVGMFLPTGSGYCGFKALKNVSLYGSTNISSYPTNCPSCSSDCENTDYYKYAYGSYCSTPEPDPTTTNPPTTFSSNNASQLKNSLSAIFQDIAKNVSSGSSAAIASTSNQGSILLQSVFWPQKTFDNGAKVSWVGKLYAWWLQQSAGSAPQIKADNDGNKQLNPSDTTITFGSTNQSTILDQNKPIFEAGAVLLSTLPDDRTIYTTTDGKTLISFGTSKVEVDSISPYFGSLPSYLGSSNQAANLINYIRGTDFTDLGARSRSVGVSGVWKLGDIVYSSPSVMQAVDYTDASKTYNVIFVGANDGMLHAFLLGQPINTYKQDPVVVLCNDNKFTVDSSGNVACSDGNNQVGSELWAFIPKNSLPYLKYLADPNYDSSKHIYFSDLEPFVFRIYTNNGVKTILIGGMRFGGCVSPLTDAGYSSYYALDVTDPKNPLLLWEFSNLALGFSYSGPAIIKEYDGTQNKYFAVFLSGPTNYDGTSTQSLSLFIIDLLSGQLLQTITNFGGSTYQKAFGGRLFTGGIVDNANSLTQAIPFGISYQDPNNNWHGKVFLLNTFENSDYAKWQVIPVPLGMDIGPVTAQVATSKCQNIRQYIYFGTGRYFKPTDGITLPNENIFGVDVTECINSASCTTNNITKITPSNQINASYVPGFSWYMPLTDNGERDISDPSSGSTAVTFTTALPTGTNNVSNSLCISGYGGQANVWSLMCGTGAPNTSTDIYLISTSSGGIYAASANSSNTTGKIGTFSGIPSIKKPAKVSAGTNKGIIIQWLEK